MNNHPVMKDLQLHESDYRVMYEEGREYNYNVYRHNEDVTEQMKNNLVYDLIFDLVQSKEKIKELENQLGKEDIDLE